MRRRLPNGSLSCNRRTFLHAGLLPWFGLGLPKLLQAQESASRSGERRPIRGVLFAFCPGGPSHLETFDPKPDAPVEIRGEFGTIATALPGVRFGEYLPRLARVVDRMTLVRSMTTTSPVHELAVHRLLCGVDETPPGTGVTASRKDRPHLGALVTALRPAPPGLPHSVILPTNLTFEGAPFPGQNAGFLGARYDPWHLLGDPTAPGFRPEALELPEGLSIARLDRRKTLLETINQARRELDHFASEFPTDGFHQRAIALVTSRACRDAFDLDLEDPKLRDRYGRTLMGQGLLLGRRLIEAGVPLVQINLGESNVWDTHEKNFERHRDTLCPPFDLAVSALVEDLDTRDLMDEILVIVTGEFGRTPRVGMPIKGGAGAKPDGRDHWPGVFTSLAFGAGVGRGQVIGSSDRLASAPTTSPYTPSDLGASILHALGIDPTIEIHDPLGRPFPINLGTPIPWS